MKSQNRILWLVPKWSLPATDGARIATEKLLKNVVACGADVDLLCLANSDEKPIAEQMISEWGVKNVFIHHRELPTNSIGKIKFYLKNLLLNPSMPLTMSSFSTKKIREYLYKHLEVHKYDIIVFDGLHLAAPFISNKGLKLPKGLKAIYRAHNIEQDLWLKSVEQTNNVIKKTLFAWQAKLISKVEQITIKNSDLVAPISKEDKEWIETRFPKVQTHLTLLGMDFSTQIPMPMEELNHFLFLGRLDWAPNRDGLAWLLENVWPKVNHDRSVLHIAGSGNGEWLKKYLPQKNVVFHGFVDSVDEMYGQVDATVAPLFYGSGTRIKVVESYSKGRAMIATGMGAQGSGLIEDVDFTRAETATQWIHAIDRFDKNKAHNQLSTGLERLRNTMDEKLVAKSFYNRLL
ncbi:MAG: glycosyltransferase family 4 protein [Bacteriovoracaceae bacterium]|nr:glycosyltransferase family 4 protein [Bacteriovoracaceae bacterium]